MTDMETTPSPGKVPAEDATARATTQLIAPDTTQLIAPDTTQSMAPDTPPPAAAEKTDSTGVRPWFKKKRFALPSAVFVVFVAIMISTGGNDPGIFDLTTSPLESTVEGAANTPATATIGQSVRDGKFAFIVTSVQPPSKILTERLGVTENAQGEFVIVRISVTNIGYEARALTATDQFLISDKGQRFATSAAISSLAGSEKIFLEKINPGHTVNGAPLLFDVAPGTRITSIELHDSATSAGVKVRLP